MWGVYTTLSHISHADHGRDILYRDTHCLLSVASCPAKLVWHSRKPNTAGSSGSTCNGMVSGLSVGQNSDQTVLVSPYASIRVFPSEFMNDGLVHHLARSDASLPVTILQFSDEIFTYT